MSAVGFHDGERAVQRRAGVETEAARLEGMLHRATLSGGFARFLAGRRFAALAGRDGAGRLWVSALAAEPGFLAVDDPTTLTIATTPVVGDPLYRLPAGQAIGIVVIEFATRRRVRVNGTLTEVSDRELRIDVDQAYGNCPQYIQPRSLTPAPGGAASGTTRRSGHLTADDVAQLRRADTVFVGTAHPTRGTDASHRGGPAGFVRVDGNRLSWPDYQGNAMFNTLGNLEVDARAALLVPDFRTGTSLQLAGTALTEWIPAGAPDDADGTGRRVRFDVDEVVSGRLLPVRAQR